MIFIDRIIWNMTLKMYLFKKAKNVKNRQKKKKNGEASLMNRFDKAALYIFEYSIRPFEF